MYFIVIPFLEAIELEDAIATLQGLHIAAVSVKDIHAAIVELKKVMTQSEKQREEPVFSITLKSLTGKMQNMLVRRSDKVRSIKMQLEIALNIPMSMQRLVALGQKLNDELSIGDYCLSEGSIVFMVLEKMYCGGKRGHAAVAKDVDKEDIINGFQMSIVRDMLVLGVMDSAMLMGAKANIELVAQTTADNPSRACYDIMETMSVLNLRKLVEVLNTKNGDQKFRILRGIVYSAALKDCKKIVLDIANLEGIMDVTMRYCVSTAYASEKGDIGWSLMSGHVMDIISAKERQAGAAAVARIAA